MIDINNEQELRKIIMQHFVSPLFKGLKNHPDAYKQHAKSPTCADEMEIEVLIKNRLITEVSFNGTACAVATASADIFFGLIINTDVEYAKNLIAEYEVFLATGVAQTPTNLHELVVFKNLYKQKNRIVCARLATDAFQEALSLNMN